MFHILPLSAEGNRIRIASWEVVKVETVFNFLRKLACYNQNWFLHVGISDSKLPIESSANKMHSLPPGLAFLLPSLRPALREPRIVREEFF
jgi:hypothetical protein